MMSDLLKYVIITFKVDASDESEDDRKKTFFRTKMETSSFTNIPIAQGSVEPDMDETVVDIARTSAAPTYSSSSRIR